MKSTETINIFQIAKVIDDYFEKPKIETASERTARLRDSMLKNNQEFKAVVS